jgi:hypothetical protein
VSHSSDTAVADDKASASGAGGQAYGLDQVFDWRSGTGTRPLHGSVGSLSFVTILMHFDLPMELQMSP